MPGRGLGSDTTCSPSGVVRVVRFSGQAHVLTLKAGSGASPELKTAWKTGGK